MFPWLNIGQAREPRGRKNGTLKTHERTLAVAACLLAPQSPTQLAAVRVVGAAVSSARRISTSQRRISARKRRISARPPPHLRRRRISARKRRISTRPPAPHHRIRRRHYSNSTRWRQQMEPTCSAGIPPW